MHCISYSPMDHANSEAHHKLQLDYTKWMKRKLEFKPSIKSRVKDTLETIARKMDLKASKVTWIGKSNFYFKIPPWQLIKA